MGDGQSAKAGYREEVALSAYCPTCQRTVFLEEQDTQVCPVCSSPLLRAIEEAEEDQGAPR
jgi:Zn finger protein HypA/HybF involved in hydrogenase expression